LTSALSSFLSVPPFLLFFLDSPLSCLTSPSLLPSRYCRKEIVELQHLQSRFDTGADGVAGDTLRGFLQYALHGGAAAAASLLDDGDDGSGGTPASAAAAEVLPSFADLVSDKLSALSYCYHNLAVEMEFMGNEALCLQFYEKAFQIAVGNGRTRQAGHGGGGAGAEDGISVEVDKLRESYLSALRKYNPGRYRKDALAVRESVRQMQKRRKQQQQHHHHDIAGNFSAVAATTVEMSVDAHTLVETGGRSNSDHRSTVDRRFLSRTEALHAGIATQSVDYRHRHHHQKAVWDPREERHHRRHHRDDDGSVGAGAGQLERASVDIGALRRAWHASKRDDGIGAAVHRTQPKQPRARTADTQLSRLLLLYIDSICRRKGCRLIDLFNREMDRDKGSTVDRRELDRFFRSISLEMEPPLVKGIFKLWDKDGSGGIDIMELGGAMRMTRRLEAGGGVGGEDLCFEDYNIATSAVTAHPASQQQPSLPQRRDQHHHDATRHHHANGDNIRRGSQRRADLTDDGPNRRRDASHHHDGNVDDDNGDAHIRMNRRRWDLNHRREDPSSRRADRAGGLNVNHHLGDVDNNDNDGDVDNNNNDNDDHHLGDVENRHHYSPSRRSVQAQADPRLHSSPPSAARSPSHFSSPLTSPERGDRLEDTGVRGGVEDRRDPGVSEKVRMCLTVVKARGLLSQDADAGGSHHHNDHYVVLFCNDTTHMTSVKAGGDSDADRHRSFIDPYSVVIYKSIMNKRRH
jgi:hypothetical protein